MDLFGHYYLVLVTSDVVSGVLDTGNMGWSRSRSRASETPRLPRSTGSAPSCPFGGSGVWGSNRRFLDTLSAVYTEVTDPCSDI